MNHLFPLLFRPTVLAFCMTFLGQSPGFAADLSCEKIIDFIDHSVDLANPASLATHLQAEQCCTSLSEIEIRHLLTMTSGLVGYFDDAFLQDAIDDPETVQTPQSAVSYAYGEALMFRPGRAFDYSNTNYVLLGLILENVTGKSYAQVMAEQVFKPAGMKDAFVFGSRALPATFPKGHAGWSHYRDYYNAQGFGDGGVIPPPLILRDFIGLFRLGNWNKTILLGAKI